MLAKFSGNIKAAIILRLPLRRPLGIIPAATAPEVMATPPVGRAAMKTMAMG